MPCGCVGPGTDKGTTSSRNCFSADALSRGETRSGCPSSGGGGKCSLSEACAGAGSANTSASSLRAEAAASAARSPATDAPRVELARGDPTRSNAAPPRSSAALDLRCSPTATRPAAFGGQRSLAGDLCSLLDFRVQSWASCAFSSTITRHNERRETAEALPRSCSVSDCIALCRLPGSSCPSPRLGSSRWLGSPAASLRTSCKTPGLDRPLGLLLKMEMIGSTSVRKSLSPAGDASARPIAS